ncbi:hypothetical protein B0H12DRAFT_654696 [Mycena haematopus]|nr:hypothetical protein B0H12DRAFT_654696 [Mycena haematopus]
MSPRGVPIQSPPHYFSATAIEYISVSTLLETFRRLGWDLHSLGTPFPLPPHYRPFHSLPSHSLRCPPPPPRSSLPPDAAGLAIMEKKSSLPPSIQPYIWTRPQEPQGLSPTASSPGVQEEVPELPGPIHSPPRQTAFPALPPLPAAFPDVRRQYSGYETGARDPVGVHIPAGLPAPERLAGPSSIPHGFAGRYRSPVVSDPRYPVAGRSQVPSAYPGSQSLPALSQITSGGWREGEAGPSSLVHSQPYGGGSRRPSPTYPPPQPIYRRATEPWGYSSAEGTEAQRKRVITSGSNFFLGQSC